mgnify:CR=1 FL=1
MTTRRQVSFQALIIALMSDGKLDPIVVSSCIFMEDETAEKEVESVFKINTEGLQNLIDFAENKNISIIYNKSVSSTTQKS